MATVAENHRTQVQKIASALPDSKDAKDLRKKLQDESIRGVVDPAYYMTLIQDAQQMINSNKDEEKRKAALAECSSLMAELANEAKLTPQEQASAGFSPLENPAPGLEGKATTPSKLKSGDTVYFPLHDLKDTKARVSATDAGVYLQDYDKIKPDLQGRALAGLANAAKSRYGEGAQVSLSNFNAEKYNWKVPKHDGVRDVGFGERFLAGLKTNKYREQCDNLVRETLAAGLKINPEQLRHIDPKVVEEGKRLCELRAAQHKAAKPVVTTDQIAAVAKKGDDNTLTVSSAKPPESTTILGPGRSSI